MYDSFLSSFFFLVNIFFSKIIKKVNELKKHLWFILFLVELFMQMKWTQFLMNIFFFFYIVVFCLAPFISWSYLHQYQIVTTNSNLGIFNAFRYQPLLAADTARCGALVFSVIKANPFEPSPPNRRGVWGIKEGAPWSMVIITNTLILLSHLHNTTCIGILMSKTWKYNICTMDRLSTIHQYLLHSNLCLHLLRFFPFSFASSV